MSGNTVELKLVIDNKRGVVLLAEADEKFVDALTDEFDDTDTLVDIVRQTAPADSSAVNLCDSYDDLYGLDSNTSSDSDDDAIYCCHICLNWYAYEKSACPDCREDLSKVPNRVESPSPTPAGIYMITDDLKFKRMSALSMMNHMLTRVSVDGPDTLEEKVVKLTLDEVGKLVRASLHSKMVLTDFFLNKAEAEDKSDSDDDDDDDDDDDENEDDAEGAKKEEFVIVNGD